MPENSISDYLPSTENSDGPIHAALLNSSVGYWLDTGNGAKTGQVVLGEPKNRSNASKKMRLPTVVELFPELMDVNIPEDDAPSCSLAAALEKQDLFVNQSVATAALNLLWCLLREGGVNYHGVFINLNNQQTNTLPVDPIAWQRFVGQAENG